MVTARVRDEPASSAPENLQAAREIAAAVPDPELPMMTLADLGILRDVTAQDGQLVVTITPTYSGCPALREIAHDLRHRLSRAGFEVVEAKGLNYAGPSLAAGRFDADAVATARGLFSQIEDCYLLGYVCRVAA